ncbi:M23 family metallopeptidase [Allopontixanthobacter sediminis]|uniref:Peptidoglycan DD-metalloendopeptidase family protein n=1 Tax=Allopontixanthobacter sediminis TaxID=1689985 RepID=A0A845AW62_9SPHN|nr:M23 family metallopeptidase [Allopontixanthobacter sediminis]MXP43783.1 peptidoglycan DD-metalloendopeptidase family protein [Allopontixanthobacter sediminis]
MASSWIDRTLTIVITATITSAVWIVAGGTLMEMSDSAGQRNSTRPADAAPSPATVPEAILARPTGEPTEGSSLLDQGGIVRPGAGRNNDLMVPVLNVRPSDLTDSFTDARGDTTNLHEAIDIMAPEGTTVVAAAPGTIEKMFTSKAGGKTLYVRSADRLTIHYYAHLSEYAQGLREGQRIRRGQRLGGVGSSGNASEEAPHLHFAILRTTADAEWWEPANAINPYTLLTKK